MPNPFDAVTQRDSYVMYMHLEFAESCLRRAQGMQDEYAGVVLRRKGLEHVQKGMQAVSPEWKHQHGLERD